MHKKIINFAMLALLAASATTLARDLDDERLPAVRFVNAIPRIHEIPESWKVSLVRNNSGNPGYDLPVPGQWNVPYLHASKYFETDVGAAMWRVFAPAAVPLPSSRVGTVTLDALRGTHYTILALPRAPGSPQPLKVGTPPMGVQTAPKSAPAKRNDNTRASSQNQQADSTTAASQPTNSPVTRDDDIVLVATTQYKPASTDVIAIADPRTAQPAPDEARLRIVNGAWNVSGAVDVYLAREDGNTTAKAAFKNIEFLVANPASGTDSRRLLKGDYVLTLKRSATDAVLMTTQLSLGSRDDCLVIVTAGSHAADDTNALAVMADGNPARILPKTH